MARVVAHCLCRTFEVLIVVGAADGHRVLWCRLSAGDECDCDGYCCCGGEGVGGFDGMIYNGNCNVNLNFNGL